MGSEILRLDAALGTRLSCRLLTNMNTATAIKALAPAAAPMPIPALAAEERLVSVPDEAPPSLLEAAAVAVDDALLECELAVVTTAPLNRPDEATEAVLVVEMPLLVDVAGATGVVGTGTELDEVKFEAVNGAWINVIEEEGIKLVEVEGVKVVEVLGGKVVDWARVAELEGIEVINVTEVVTEVVTKVVTKVVTEEVTEVVMEEEVEAEGAEEEVGGAAAAFKGIAFGVSVSWGFVLTGSRLEEELLVLVGGGGGTEVVVAGTAPGVVVTGGGTAELVVAAGVARPPRAVAHIALATLVTEEATSAPQPEMAQSRMPKPKFAMPHRQLSWLDGQPSEAPSFVTWLIQS